MKFSNFCILPAGIFKDFILSENINKLSSFKRQEVAK